MEHLAEQNQTPSPFGRLLVALAQARVDFAVAGGLAVIFNGYSRLTLDADIIVEDSPANLERLLHTLSNWGEGWARELNIEDFPPEEGAVRLVEEFDLDIFTRLRGLSWTDFAPRLRHVTLAGTGIPYLSPQDLVHCKENSQREKDRLDVLAMKEILQRESAHSDKTPPSSSS